MYKLPFWLDDSPLYERQLSRWNRVLPVSVKIGLRGPSTDGFFIYLPSWVFNESREVFDTIICHEIAHIKLSHVPARFLPSKQEIKKLERTADAYGYQLFLAYTQADPLCNDYWVNLANLRSKASQPTHDTGPEMKPQLSQSTVCPIKRRTQMTIRSSEMSLGASKTSQHKIIHMTILGLSYLLSIGILLRVIGDKESRSFLCFGLLVISFGLTILQTFSFIKSRKSL